MLISVLTEKEIKSKVCFEGYLEFWKRFFHRFHKNSVIFNACDKRPASRAVWAAHVFVGSKKAYLLRKFGEGQ